VGLFTSPFIELFNERICINNIPIPDSDLERITDRIRPIVAELEKEDVFCTVFDVICAVGFTYFAEQKCDVVVLEVGLGGRFDATNIIKAPFVSVIASISLDHTAILGDTVEEIASEKCGIIKQGGTTVCYPLQQSSVFNVINDTCKEKNNTLIIPDVTSVSDIDNKIDGVSFEYRSRAYKLSMSGQYQVYNAVKIPIVGMGGVSTAEDVIEFMLAGATAVQVGAANLVEPYACKNIIESLPAAMEKYGIKSLNDIIGGAHRWAKM
jgi:dihydrofolate synthase/folylpolyglutamate synthase